MDTPSATFVAVALVLTAMLGASFAQWRRALSDWRKTVASIPGLRKNTFEHGRRMALLGGGVALVLYIMMIRG